MADLCTETRQVGVSDMACTRLPHPDEPNNHSFAATRPADLYPHVPRPELLARFLDMAYLHPADHELSSHLTSDLDMVLECNYCSEPPNDYYVGPAYDVTEEARLAFATHVVRCHADVLVQGWDQ